jgi:hypothetical protein
MELFSERQPSSCRGHNYSRNSRLFGVARFAKDSAATIASLYLCCPRKCFRYWLAPAAEARLERIIFLNHLALIGGMLAIVAFGAGCWSLDAAMGRKSA